MKILRSILLISFLLLLSSKTITIYAQAPGEFSYQAIVRDVSGEPIPSTEVDIIFSIRAATPGGTTIYSETHTLTTNPYGLINAKIGTGTTSDNFSAINWSAGLFFLNTNIDGNDMGTTQLISVPYALYADKAGNVFSGVYNDLTSKPDLSVYLDGQWTKFQDSLYYMGGNVGIGTLNPRSTLSVAGSTASDSAIFEVKNNNGKTVFAVYENGVQVNIDETAGKSARGGFSVGGFDASKGFTDYMNITSDSIRLYIDNSATNKGAKGGFAVGGFDKTPSKASRTSTYLAITGEEDANSGYNTYLGYEAGGDGGGHSNTAIGYYAGYNMSPFGHDNIFIGDSAGVGNLGGYQNIFIGKNSGKKVYSGYNNVYIGYRTGSEGHGQYNIFIGDEAGRYNNSGFANVFMGDKAGQNVTNGYRNTIIGAQAGQDIAGGDQNTFIGTAAGRNSAGANRNTFLGNFAGYNNITGNSNTYIGHQTGYGTIGSNNIFIGPEIGYGISDSDNRLLIDIYNTTNPDLAYISGDMATDLLRLNARTGIKTAPEAGFDLTVAGNVKALSFDSPSDIRLKTNISTIISPLQKVLQLRGVTYNWNDDYKADEKSHIGFIAQEALEVIPELVNTTGAYYSISYAPITALLVEAVKELKKENDELREEVQRINSLENQIEELKKLIMKK